MGKNRSKHIPNKSESERLQAQGKREKSELLKLQTAKLRDGYIKNLVAGRYFLQRANMIAEQIRANKILESIDGCPKTKEFMIAEYAHQKIQAIHNIRSSHFQKQDLIKDFGYSEQEILDLEDDYYNGKIIREEYDECYGNEKKASFENQSEN